MIPSLIEFIVCVEHTHKNVFCLEYETYNEGKQSKIQMQWRSGELFYLSIPDS